MYFLPHFLLWFPYQVVISFPYLPCSRFLRLNDTLFIEFFKRKQDSIKQSEKSDGNGQESEKILKFVRSGCAKEKDERGYLINTEQIKIRNII